LKLVTFTQKDDIQCIGALVDSDQTIVILQMGAKAMDGDLSPFFTDMLAFLRGAEAARDKAQVNGDEWSRETSADMYWTFEEIIAYMSQSETLYPGEFIGSGTCSGAQGRGCGLEIGKFLRAGDVVELEVESIGVLRNQVVKG
jgi:2-keto-4-pentenoate hydratase/2-oxohepta-3-ene-1,7-dioic acid hydratase in catechol pathway